MKKQTKLVKKRRHQGKTNYNRRLVLLKGGCLRFVVRKSNKYLVMQIVESVHAQDKVLIGISTKELLKHGWPEDRQGSLKSLGAAYLGGLLLGRKAGEKIKGRVILDLGLIPNTKGSRVYAGVKGLRDSGVDISVNEEVFPEDEKINKYEFFDEVKNKIGVK